MNKAIYFIAAGIAALIMSVLIIKADTPDTTPVVISESQAEAHSCTGGTFTAAPAQTMSGINETSQVMKNTAQDNDVTAETAANSSNTNGLININQADCAMLVTLKGIGEKKAAAIIEYREANGGFTSIEEIKNVKGIGDKTFENIKELICV